MRVSIDHSEKKTGLIFKKPKFGVTVGVQFSEEERAIITTRKLKDYIVLKRDYEFDSAVRDDPSYQSDEFRPHLYIRTLMKGPDTYHFPDPVAAKGYEQQLVASLKTLKSFLEGSQSVGQSKSFEL